MKNKILIISIFFILGFWATFSLVNAYDTSYGYLAFCENICIDPDPSTPPSCLDATDSCAPIIATYGLPENVPSSFTDGTNFCHTFDSIGNIFDTTLAPRASIVPTICTFQDYQSGTGNVEQCPTPFTPIPNMFANAVGLSTHSLITSSGSTHELIGGYYMGTAAIPATCCAGAYPSVYGVCPPPPDFTLSVAPVPPAAPLTRMVAQGGSTTYPVTCVGINGFTGPVAINDSTLSGWPSGVTVSPLSINCSPGGTTTNLTVNVSGSASTGDYPLVISGDGAMIGRRNANPVLLQVRQQPNFSLTVTNTPQTVSQGSSATFIIRANCFGTFVGSTVTNVGVTSGLPAYASQVGGNVSIPCEGTSSITVSTQNTPPNVTPVSVSSLTFTGTGAGVGNRTTTAVLNVTAADTFYIDSFIANSPLTVVPYSTTFTVNVSGTLTGTTNYTFWWNCNNPSTSVTDMSRPTSLGGCNDPDGTSGNNNGNKFDNRPVGANSQTTVSHSYGSAGTYYVKVIAERGSSAITQILPITVLAPAQDYSLSISPLSNSINLGETASYVVTLDCINGYDPSAYPVNFYDYSVVNEQTGSAISFSPPYLGNPLRGRITSCGGSVTARITADSDTVTGTVNNIFVRGYSSYPGINYRQSVIVSLTINAPSVDCSPNPHPMVQVSPQPGSTATFTASGGDGNYSWSTPADGNPTSGTGLTFSTSFSNYGFNRPVTVTSNGESRTCLVTVNQPPTIANVTARMPNYCVSGPSTVVTWSDYEDADGYTRQASLQIQVDERSEDFSTPVYDSGQINSSGTSYFVSGSGIVGGTGITFGHQYKARVRVWDGGGGYSNWYNQSLCVDIYDGYGPGKSCINPNSNYWTAPDHSYPNVDFSWSPSSPAPVAGQDVQFTDASRCYNDSGVQVACSSWLWQFCDDSTCSTSTSSTDEDPIKNWASSGIFNVTDRVTDADGYRCSRSKLVNVEQAIPTWEEVPIN